MKSILLIVLIVVFSFGADKLTREECEQTMGAGVYNQILEDTCHFSGEVSASLMQIFAIGKCKETIGSESINRVAGEVLSDTLPRYKKFGKEIFCKENWKGYDDLYENAGAKKNFDLSNVQ